jgi:phage major head subunit gpT-like protein
MLSHTNIVVAEKVFKTIYNEALQKFSRLDPWTRLATLAMEVPSDGSEEDYRWLGALPVFQEWIGDIDVDELADYSYTLRNKHFAAAVGIDADEIADDKFGIIRPRIEGLAVRAMQHRGKMIQDLILNGTTYEAFDGVAFFSNASGLRTIDNLGTGTISAGTPTLAQVEADIDTMRQTVMQFADDKDETIGLITTVYACHPKLERLFRTVMQSTADPATSNAGAANPFKEWVEDVVVLPGASDVNDVYGFVVNMPVKPLVFQNRQASEQWLDETGAKKNRLLHFGADYRGNFGYSLPHLAVKLVSAVA